jgi:hypothetical protein
MLEMVSHGLKHTVIGVSESEDTKLFELSRIFD